MKWLIRQLLIWLRVVERPDMIGRVLARHPTPDELVRGALVVVRDGAISKWVCFRCPCGCGERIMLSLAPQRRPHWTVGLDWLGRPTLSPSVDQATVCRSHYWIKRGRIEWCIGVGKNT